MRSLLFTTLLLTAAAFQAQAQSTREHTPSEELIYRVNFGNSEDVRLLLEKGADPNAKSPQGEPVIDMAMERHDAETLPMVKALLDKGADVEILDRTNNTPLVNALRYQLSAVVKLLLEKGADYHVKAPDDSALIDYARKIGDKESAAALQVYLEKDAAEEAKMRTPERFQIVVTEYAKSSCMFQYWSYFLSSRQDSSKDDDTRKKIDDAKQKISKVIMEIQKYYPNTSNSSLQAVSSQAVDKIFRALDSMISNSNRAENHVGTEDDAQHRCDKVVTEMKINVRTPAPKTE